MPKIPKYPLFFKIYLPLLDAGLDWHQAAVLQYVERLTARKLPCFASAETIGAELRIPYGTIRRVIDSLIAQKYLLANKHKRQRILQLAPLYYQTLEGAQNEHYQNSIGAQNEQLEGAQNEQLPRSNKPRSNYLDLDLSKLNLGLKLDKLDQSSNQLDQYTMEWNEERKAMVRRRCR
jgi:hypothetical protein